MKPIDSISNESFEIAIIGLGKWGKRVILPVLADRDKFDYIKKIHLVVGSNLSKITDEYGDDENKVIYKKEDIENVLRNPSIKAVIISVPLKKHYELAKLSLMSYKDVFIEKPFVSTKEQAKELIDLSKKNNCVLMVGYEFMYDPRFKKLKQIIDNGILGSIDKVYLNIFNRKHSFKSKSSSEMTIVENLVTHQLSILQLLFENHDLKDLKVLKAEAEHIKCSFIYNNVKIVVEAASNYFEKSKLRDIDIVGKEKTVSLDFSVLDAPFMLTYTESGEAIKLNSLNNVDEHILRNCETPIKAEFDNFLESCKNRTIPISGIKNSIHIIDLTNKISEAYREERSRQVTLKQDSVDLIKFEILKQVFCLALGYDENYITIRNYGLLIKINEDELCKYYVENIFKVIEYLLQKPYSDAKAILDKFDLTKEELIFYYKVIQKSDLIQIYLRKSNNFDYFNAIDFIEKRSFEVTFFVGLWCPYKCIFCQTVKLLDDGTRKILKYPYKKDHIISKKAIIGVLDDLADMKKKGRPVTAKISGGLEPLSDIETVKYILDECNKRGIPTKIYTNGFLLDTPEKRRIVLSSTNMRISLNAVTAEDFSMLYGRPETDFDILKHNIMQLFSDRIELGSSTKIGMKSVITKSIASRMGNLVKLSKMMGFDFIDLSPDFLEYKDEKTNCIIELQKDKIISMIEERVLSNFHINFGGSLFKGNVFSNRPNDRYLPNEQIDYKLFIDPAGQVVPIHEGAFPKGYCLEELRNNPLSIGVVSEDVGLYDVLSKRNPLVEIDYKILNPFELILALEFTRERRDRELGLNLSNSPYHKSRRHDAVPLNLSEKTINHFKKMSTDLFKI